MRTVTKTASKGEAKPAQAPARAFSSARSILLQRKCACATGGAECEACKKKEAEEQKKAQEQRLQKSPTGPSRSATAPRVVNHVLNSPGRPLDSSTRSFMEPRFGRDLSAVRIHTDSQAAESARAVDAHAYTVGQHIVFDQGKYDPNSGSGGQLLAHELAHTVQQHGLQRSSGDLSLSETSEYHRLEREADSIARFVMSGSGSHGAPALNSHPVRPLISRADRKKIAEEIAKTEEGEKTTESTPPSTDSERKWKMVAPGTPLGKVGVKQIAEPGTKEIGADIVVASMRDPLQLPAEKGDKKIVETLWNDRASAGALEALVDVSGEGQQSPRIALKQGRPDTKALRKIWLEKVGWNEEGAAQSWKAAGGDKESFDPPQAGGKTCHVDHIVELQFGGTNVPMNLQMLDGAENMLSGRKIFQDLKDQAASIRTALPDAKNVILHYDKAEQREEIKGPCVEVENKAKGVPGGKAEIKGEPYEIKAGGMSAKLILPEGKPKKVRDQSAATIIPGMLLDIFESKGGPGKDVIVAIMDVKKETGTKTRLPVRLEKEEPIDLIVAPDRNLKLLKKRPNIKFHYDYLSDGVFTQLNLEEDGSLSGKGEIKTSIPFLPKLNVKFDKDSFALVAPLDAKKLHPPIPGAKITEGEIGLQLAPEFKPYGSLAFELAVGPKKLLDSKLEVSGDARGLVATGVIHVFLPGVDNAQGDIKYQNQEWSGGVKIEAGQLQNKLKYVKSGSVLVGFSSKGVSALGTVNLDIPHTEKGVDVSLLYERHKWIFKGKGAFTPPRLKPVEIEMEYDGDHLSGSAETGFEFHGLTGRLRVSYRDEKFSGEGTIDIKKGRAQGKLHVKMVPGKDTPKFSGGGEITYQVSENLVATAGIIVDEEEKVRLKGALQFPKPIHLFDPIKGDYKIFEVGISIPIPGASIGPVGLKARIEGALSAGYQIGPGELRNVKVEAAFNPLEEKPDLDLLMGAQLYIGARAYISGSITGAIEVDVGIASLSGGLTVTATASLEGHVLSEVKIHYQKSRFEVDANFELLLALALILALDAVVRAKAGIGPFSVETKKVWNLAAFKFDTGMELGMKLKNPIHYASDQPFKFPSLDDIEWIKPKIDPKQVLDRAFGSGSSKEEGGA